MKRNNVVRIDHESTTDAKQMRYDFQRYLERERAAVRRRQFWLDMLGFAGCVLITVGVWALFWAAWR